MNTVTQGSNASRIISEALAVIDARTVVRASVGSTLGRLDCLKEWDARDEFYQGTPYCNAPAHLAQGIGLVMQFIQACQNANILLQVAIAGKAATQRQIAQIIAALDGTGVDASALTATLVAVQQQSLMLQQAYDLQSVLQQQGHDALNALSARMTTGYAGHSGRMH